MQALIIIVGIILICTIIDLKIKLDESYEDFTFYIDKCLKLELKHERATALIAKMKREAKK